MIQQIVGDGRLPRKYRAGRDADAIRQKVQSWENAPINDDLYTHECKMKTYAPAVEAEDSITV